MVLGPLNEYSKCTFNLSVLTINDYKMSDLDDRERPVIIDDRERDRDVIIKSTISTERGGWTVEF
jgi:hypothetical protein